ncbi:MAG: hypothetical protein ACOYYF_16220 [Chloroflexota bacterium]|nr:hypothetical protein [Chloroflexota bacterium]
MSGPYPTSVTLVSGREDANEILYVCGAFVHYSYNSLDLISRNAEAEKALNLAPFLILDFLFPMDYLDAVIKLPLLKVEQASPNTLFWIALDESGYNLAKRFFYKHRIDFAKPVYKNVKKLNHIGGKIPPYPYLSKKVWMNLLDGILLYRHERRRIRNSIERREFLLKRLHLSPEVEAYVEWMNTVEEIMLPWRRIIQEIQSDWS